VGCVSSKDQSNVDSVEKSSADLGFFLFFVFFYVLSILEFSGTASILWQAASRTDDCHE